MSCLRRALPALLLALAATGACGAPGGDQAAPRPSAASEPFRPLAVGDAVPALALRTIAGDTVRVGPGEPVTLVNVWATWCTSCREEMRDLEAVHRDFARRGLRVLAVSVDDGDGARVRRFATQQRLTMPIAHDPAGRVQELYQVMAVPETYLIGTDGRLRWRQAGGVHADPLPLRAAVESALGGG